MPLKFKKWLPNAEVMSEDSQQVSSSVEEATTIAKNNESTQKKIAKSVEEQQHGINKNSEVSDTIIAFADELEKVIQKFCY